MNVWLICLVILPAVNSLFSDDNCYKSFVESFQGESDDSNTYFQETILRCLGEDANVDSKEFINCLIANNKCVVDWYSLVNWKFCVCDSFLTNLKHCATKWISQDHFGDLSCFKNIVSDCSSCLTRQKLHKN